LPPLTGVMT